LKLGRITLQPNKALKVHFVTNACEEGRLDTQRLKLFSKNVGFSCTNDVKQADLILFFACGHLFLREAYALRIIEDIQRVKKRSAQLIVWGCLPMINPGALRKVYGGPLIGPEEWNFFSDLFNQPRGRIDQVFANAPISRKEDFFSRGRIIDFIYQSLYAHRGWKWYIKIVSGCRNRCTYCVDLLAYKSIRSVPIDKILRQFELGLAANCKHFFFVGRDLGSYGYDIGLTLADLLNKIAETYRDQTYKISLQNVSPEFLITLYPKLDHALLSQRVFEIGSGIQSGSERILKLMGKTFKLDDWKETLQDIDRKYPNIRLATNIMVGFPGETEEDFKRTKNLFRDLLFDRISVYIYNERPNLPSLRLKGCVPEAIKIRRYKEANNLRRVNTLRKKIKRTRILY
jgi:threonylcarbamoyladenosine tRNA methylthiotransferase MtaB